MKTIKKVSYILVIVGAINWGLVGIAGLDLVALIFDEGSILSRIVYVLVGISGVLMVTSCKKADCHCNTCTPATAPKA